MKITKSSWIKHDDANSPIYSIDINSAEDKFATAGQNESGGGLVVIWNLKALIGTAEGTENVPRQLCRMESHTASVNCVRWSSRGAYLASSANDKYVMIWQFVGKTTQQTNFGGRPGNIERWKCVSTLRAHTGDVLHVAWSPDDSYLASCSVDNTIVVWNGRKFGETVMVLKGHESLVKGLIWDPIGKYLASQSEDKTMKIWSTSNWSCVQTIRKPFESCAGSTQVLRLDWSPDGECVISAHAMNNEGLVAKIIPRGFTLDGSVDLVGHRKAITCARCSPCLYNKKKSDNPDTKGKIFSIAAIGSKDKSISVWNLSESRPIVVVRDVFKQTVMDISWSSDGRLLVACSMDGTVVGCMFEESEFGGARVSQDEKNRLLIDRFGAIPTVNGTLVGTENGTSVVENDQIDLIESPEIWKARQKLAAMANGNSEKKTEENKNNTAQPATSTQPVQNGNITEKLTLPAPENIIIPSVSGSSIADKQVETRLPNGKRRILPVFLSSAIETTSNGPFEAAKDASSLTTQPSISSLVLETTKLASSINTNVLPDVPTTSYSNETSVNLVITTSSVSTTTKESEVKSSSPSQPAWKRKSEAVKTEDASVQQNKKLKDRKSVGSVPVRAESQSQSLPQTSEQPKTASSQPLVPEISHLATLRKLPIPQKVKNLMTQVTTENGPTKICVANETKAVGDAKASVISCVRTTIVWESLLRSPALSLIASSNIVGVSCENQTLSVFSTLSGATLASGIITDSPISTLCSCNSYLMVITSTGGVTVWNCSPRAIHQVLSDVSLVSLLTAGDNVKIRLARVTDTGVPIVGLSTDCVYAYSESMRNWVLLVDSHDLMLMAGDIRQPGVYDKSLYGPVATVMEAIKLTMAFPGTAAIPAATRKLCTTSFFEQQLQASLVLKSPNEYRHWLFQYVSHLVRHGETVRLKELLDEFLEGSGLQESVLGMERRNLLSEMLPMLAASSQLQRLSTDYKDALDQQNAELMDME